jgi:hypothetical protein
MHMTTVKNFLMAASFGMILCGAVSAHALSSLNGSSLNGVSLNRIALNGVSLNKLTANGINPNALTATVPSDNTRGMPPSESFPWNSLSHSAVGVPGELDSILTLERSTLTK